MAPTLPVNPIDLATLLPSLLFPSPALPAVADQELLASSSPSFKPADLAAFFPNLTEDMPVVELGMETIELEINPEAGTMVTTATTTRKILFPEDASNVEGYDAEDLEGNQVWTGVEITEFDVDVNMLPPFVAAMELGTVDGNEMGYNGQSFDGGVPVTVVGMPAGLSEFADLGIAGLGPVIVVDLEDTVADGVWDVLDVKVGGAMDRKGGMVEQMGQIRGGVWNRLLEGDDADMPAAQRDGSIKYFKSGATALTLELLFLALVYAAVWAVRKWVISAKTQKRGVVTPRFAIDDGSREDMKGFRQIENLVGEVKIEGEEEMV